MRNVGWKWQKKADDFFFFLLIAFRTSETFFGVYQNGHFQLEKAKITPGKNREKWLHAGKNRQKWLCSLRKNSLLRHWHLHTPPHFYIHTDIIYMVCWDHHCATLTFRRLVRSVLSPWRPYHLWETFQKCTHTTPTTHTHTYNPTYLQTWIFW